MSEPIEEIQDQIEDWEGRLDGEEFEQTLLAKFESLHHGEPGRAELLCSLAERRLSLGDPPARASGSTWPSMNQAR